MCYLSRSLVVLAYISVAACLSACDLHIYEMREAPAGNVYVLNRMTGTLQTTKEGRLTTIQPAAQANSRQTITCSSHFPAYGIQFAVAIRVIGDSTYYRLNLMPEVEAGRTVVKDKWNAHVDRLRIAPEYRMARANLNLETMDGFSLYEHHVDLSDTAQLLDDGKSGSQRQAQGHFALSREVLDVLSECSVGFAGFPLVGEDLSEPIPNVSDRPE